MPFLTHARCGMRCLRVCGKHTVTNGLWLCHCGHPWNSASTCGWDRMDCCIVTRIILFSERNVFKFPKFVSFTVKVNTDLRLQQRALGYWKRGFSVCLKVVLNHAVIHSLFFILFVCSASYRTIQWQAQDRSGLRWQSQSSCTFRVPQNIYSLGWRRLSPNKTALIPFQLKINLCVIKG